MRRNLTLLIAMTIVVACWSAVAPAAAASLTAVSFGGRAPQFDSDHFAHFEGIAGKTEDLLLQLDGAGTYLMWDQCDGNAASREFVVTEEDLPSVAVPIPSTTGKKICQIHIYGPQSEMYDTIYLHLLAPVYRASGFSSLSGPAFYPLVPGHPDLWRARFLANAPTQATIRIRNSVGRQVYVGTRYSRRVVPDNWFLDQWEILPTWNGRTTGGVRVRVGTYRVTIEASSRNGTGMQKIGPVRAIVKAGRRPIAASQRKIGSVGVTAAAGGCFSARQSTGWMWLNCAPSRSASAYASGTWNFVVPAGAKITRWSITGSPAADDRAGQGSITRSITRVNPTLVRLRIRINGKRAYLVDRARIEYTYFK